MQQGKIRDMPKPAARQAVGSLHSELQQGCEQLLLRQCTNELTPFRECMTCTNTTKQHLRQCRAFFVSDQIKFCHTSHNATNLGARRRCETQLRDECHGELYPQCMKCLHASKRCSLTHQLSAREKHLLCSMGETRKEQEVLENQMVCQ